MSTKTTRPRWAGLGIAAGIALLVAAGCSSDASRASGGSGRGPEEPESIGSCGPPEGLSQLAHWSNAAVIGTVSSVETHRFKASDNYRYADHYRKAVLDVEQVLWADEALPAEVGEPLAVLLLGNGRHEGRDWCHGHALWNDMDGPVTEGRRVLWLLDQWNFPGQEPGAVSNAISGHYFGNWTVAGDRAVNLVRERSAPLDALVARLVEVHDAPLDEASLRGWIDPLEASEPPPEPWERLRQTTLSEEFADPDFGEIQPEPEPEPSGPSAPTAPSGPEAG